MDSCDFKNSNRSNYAYGFSKKCELNIYKMGKFLEKKKEKKWAFKQCHWYLPQGLDCPVSPMEFGVCSILPSFKLCVFLFKIIFNVLNLFLSRIISLFNYL